MEPLNITDEELVKGIKLCLSNTLSLLVVAKNLVGKFDDDSISLGLYSYAIEEFGKALLLNDYRKRKKIVTMYPKRSLKTIIKSLYGY